MERFFKCISCQSTDVNQEDLGYFKQNLSSIFLLDCCPENIYNGDGSGLFCGLLLD